LVHVLDALFKVSSAFHTDEPTKFQSELLNQLFDTLPTVLEDVVAFKEAINPHNTDKIDFFKSEDQYPEIPKQKKNIKYIESLIDDHLVELKQTTKIHDLKFVTVAGIEYLLEVSNTKSNKVPNDWVKISNTKAVGRYHDKYIIQQLKEREQHRELLLLVVEKTYSDFLV
jgi:DNA mismatch repair protein MSH3